MKTKHAVLVVALFLSVSCAAFADRQLDRAEILQIFQELTSQPRKTWIAAGTIEAMHEEYRAPRITDSSEINRQINEKIAEYQSNPKKRELTEALQKMKLDAVPFNTRYRLSNEYTMTTAVTVRYDGKKFYWEINVNSRTDSVKPGKDLDGNYMTDHFNLDWNGRRIFAWDGEKYTVYTPSVNRAFVDSTASIPNVVNGPLTAAIIPWGYGYYTYDSLAATDSAAVEKIVDGQVQVHLTLNNSNGSTMLFVMDPAKDYAVLSCLRETNDHAVTSKQYSDYQLVSGSWIPRTILLERFEVDSNRLLASDLWDITAIDGSTPPVESFDVEYEEDALIEYASGVTDKPAMYRHSQQVDTELLLAERLAFAASEGSQQNCATAALKYATSQLGIDVSDSRLAGLVTEPSSETSLYAMKQFAEGLGLYCRAVEADIETLRNMSGCEIILHLPGKQHFVILESIDNDHVRIIDVASDKFYYRTDIGFFGMDWTEGTALLLSNNLISGEFTEIEDSQLYNITGASGYTCTKVLQESSYFTCDYIGLECVGDFIWFFKRWGCEAASSGSCNSSQMYRAWTTPCIQDPFNLEGCAVTGDWTIYWMLACA